jgi:hypothetical protein
MKAARVWYAVVALLAGVCISRAEENKLPDKATAILLKARRFDLYSLDPDLEKRETGDKLLYGWKVLGKVTVKDDRTREDLLHPLEKAIAKGGDGARCFLPGMRFTLRVTGKRSIS